MKTIFPSLFAGLVLTTSALAHDASIGELSIERPAVRAMVPGAKVGGGYLTIVNHGAQPDTLLSVRSDRAQAVQMHEMSMKNGVMAMRELKSGISVPAGQTIDLKPGGDHLMFVNVGSPFQQGEEIKATLTFEKAGSVEVDFFVGPIAGPLDAGPQDHSSMDMPDMSNMPGMSDMPGMTADGTAASDESAQSIPAILKTMFERADKPLTVEPVVVQGDWAIAGWRQDGRGGRALLKKGPHGWRLTLCSGDGIKDAASLEKVGLTSVDAAALATALHDAEAKLDPGIVKLFASFEGTVKIAEDQGGEGGHGGHQGHAQ